MGSVRRARHQARHRNVGKGDERGGRREASEGTCSQNRRRATMWKRAALFRKRHHDQAGSRWSATSSAAAGPSARRAYRKARVGGPVQARSKRDRGRVPRATGSCRWGKCGCDRAANRQRIVISDPLARHVAWTLSRDSSIPSASPRPRRPCARPCRPRRRSAAPSRSDNRPTCGLHGRAGSRSSRSTTRRLPCI